MARADTAVGGVAVTPSDSVNIYANNLQQPCNGLYVGVTGAVKVDFAPDGSNPVTFSAVPAGTILPIAVYRVYATGTSASSIVALNR